ncbi:TetR/AcrR family transcriptional regulator [Dactylosporangium vinaceum]|uniref:TetR/AcrR family transcriptional regulator n=1 Tax=Dactylosporangium vinaceum TaxID=53362 RepID=A0ABV5MQK4_9ACTN|nr:TetR/AcrR family transcriptional regulator [Dactylosporangium vinaceum]UAB96465.1 TetR/AcrR family transcriptional regulator [Dactylosporangium vinaceum]
MPRPRTSETADRIRAAAMALIAEKGVAQASLREIAERVGITKPALYYHFASREELLRGLVQPLVDDMEELLAAAEAAHEEDPQRLLADYFDVTYRHRAITSMVMTDPSVLAHLNLAAAVDGWRRRLTALMYGPEPTLAQRVRATVAIGGLGDCTILDLDAAPTEVRRATLEAAYATLGF